jgi:hypothetical protein
MQEVCTMNPKFYDLLNDAFSNVLNKDRAERATEDGIKVLETLQLFYKQTASYATNEITAINETLDILETLTYEEGKRVDR